MVVVDYDGHPIRYNQLTVYEDIVARHKSVRFDVQAVSGDGLKWKRANSSLEIDEQTLHDLVDPRDLAAHRLRGLDPDRPVLRGTAQNPDVFFQAREAANRFHAAVPDAVADRFDDRAMLNALVRLRAELGDARVVVAGHGIAAEVARARLAPMRARDVGIVSGDRPANWSFIGSWGQSVFGGGGRCEVAFFAGIAAP